MADAEKESSDALRDTAGIAKWVLGISGTAIIGISLACLLAAANSSEDSGLLQTSQMVFNALLPLLGTWVGTVLAYYFSRKNFESASQSVERMVSLTAEQKLGALAVEREMMRPFQISSFTIPPGKGAADVRLTQLHEMFGGKVTRIPVLNADASVLYIVHQSGLFKYLAEQAIKGKSAAEIEKLTLDDLSKDAELKGWLSNIVFVSEKASVAEAKKVMEQRPGCQDLIVTRTGSKNEVMLGWMTNVDIGRLSKA